MTQAQLAAGGARASTRTSCSSSRRSEQAAQKNVAANQAEGRRAAGEAEGRRQHAVPRDARLPVHEGDLRPGSLRLRGRARRPSASSAEKKQSVAEDEAKQLNELNLAMREGRRREGGDPEAARAVHRRRSATVAEADRGDERRAEAAAQAARRHRAERGQGLLPQRAAARLHGADASRSSRSSCPTSSTT